MISRLAALTLLVAGAALHAQTPCAPGPALFHISEFGPKEDKRNAVYIKLANKSALEFLRRPSATGTQYVPDEQEIRARFMEHIGEPCTSKFYKKPDDLKTDDFFVESSLRRILKQLTESEPADLGEAAAPFQIEILHQKTKIAKLEQERQKLERDKSDLQKRFSPSQAVGEYSWKNPAFFFFGGMLATPLVILARSKWRRRFFRKAKVPIPLRAVRSLLDNTKAARKAAENLVNNLLPRPPQVTAKAIADAVVEGMQRGQAQTDTLLQLLADVPFHPRFLTADLRQRLVTTTQPAADFLSQKEVDDLVTRQRFEDVRRQAIEALGLVRQAFDGLGTNSRLRALLNESSLAAMYQYADEGLSGVNLTNAIESGGAETAISVFRRLHRGELLLSTYVIPVLPDLEVESAALLLRSLQVAVNEIWILLDLMGIQPDELVLLRQPPPDAEVKQLSASLSTIQEHLSNVSRMLEQPSLSGTAICDFEEVGYSFNKQRQKRSVVYELAHNKPPRDTSSRPEPAARQEQPRRAAPVVTTIRQDTTPAEHPFAHSISLTTLEASPPQIEPLKNLLDTDVFSTLQQDDVRNFRTLLADTRTYRAGIRQLSQTCWDLFHKGDLHRAKILMEALKACGVIFKEAEPGEQAMLFPHFEKIDLGTALQERLIREDEVRNPSIGVILKQIAPCIEFDGARIHDGLIVYR